MTFAYTFVNTPRRRYPPRLRWSISWVVRRQSELDTPFSMSSRSIHCSGSIFQSKDEPEEGFELKKADRWCEEILSVMMAVFRVGRGVRGRGKLSTRLVWALQQHKLPLPPPSLSNPGPSGPAPSSRLPPLAQRRARHSSSSSLLRRCIRKAHSVSLIRPACCSRNVTVIPGFKQLPSSSSESNFSQGVR